MANLFGRPIQLKLTIIHSFIYSCAGFTIPQIISNIGEDQFKKTTRGVRSPIIDYRKSIK